jgi:hypothetical protein
MVTNGENPQARPLFRKRALGMAIVLFLLAALIEQAPIGHNLKQYAAVSCVFMSLVMLAISQAGSKLALGTAIVLFLLAALILLAPIDPNLKLNAPVSCLLTLLGGLVVAWRRAG